MACSYSYWCRYLHYLNFYVSDEGYNCAHDDHSAPLYLVITKGSARNVLWVLKHVGVDMT